MQSKFMYLALGVSLAFAADGQVITTSAGNSTWSDPVAVALDAQGNQYVASYGNHVIFKTDRLGATTVLAGTMDSYGYAGDGLATNAKLSYPQGVAVNSLGVIYIADTDNHRIRKVGPDGIITTIAGSTSGFSGDGGAAVSAKMSSPLSVTVNPAGDVFFVDYDNARIRKVALNGVITTVAGFGDTHTSGDGGPALLAGMRPKAMAIDPDGSIFFADSGNSGVEPRVRRVDPSGVVSTVAGDGTRGFSGDGGPAKTATMLSADGVAADVAGNLFIAEFSGHRIRKVVPNGIITTYAGTGQVGLSGDGGPAVNAKLYGPRGLALDTANNLYIADYYNSRIRKISPPALPAIGATNAGQTSFLGKAAFSPRSTE